MTTDPGIGAARRGALAGAALAALLAAACGRAPAPEPAARGIPVDVYADTGRSVTLRVSPPPEPPPRAAVWLARVSPGRPEPPAAEVGDDSLALPPPTPPALAVDDDLRPPLPRARAPLAVPPGARGTVELDVRVDERGEVAEVRWAAGSREPALLTAATECARAMRFFPARRAGRPVAVWCRQRFDFGAPP